MPVRTRGLSHLALSVRDPERSARFYARVFGVREYYRDDNMIQVLGPGEFDVLAFEKAPRDAGKPGGVEHFGFRLQDAEDIHAARIEVEAAGGKIMEQGEFAPGLPFLFFEDPDGYIVEVWWEPATLT